MTSDRAVKSTSSQGGATCVHTHGRSTPADRSKRNVDFQSCLRHQFYPRLDPHPCLSLETFDSSRPPPPKVPGGSCSVWGVTIHHRGPLETPR